MFKDLNRGLQNIAITMFARFACRTWPASLVMLAAVSLYAFARPAAGAENIAKAAEISYLTPAAILLKHAESVVYKKTPQGDLSLYLMRPASATSKPLPAIVYFTGGGWINGTADGMMPNAQWFREQGIIGITADYRVKSRHGTTPLECVKDAKSAIRYVRLHAKELGIDPNRIIAGGGSSGGHIAAATVLPGNDEPNEDLKVSSQANALVLHNPVLGSGFGEEFFKAHPDCSPLLGVRAGWPPTIVSCGTADDTTPYKYAQDFVNKMKAAKNACELITLPGAPHSGDWPATNPNFLPTIKRMAIFLSEHRVIPPVVFSAQGPGVSLRDRFIPDVTWPDDNGVHINAHSAGVIAHEGVYYWFGEHKIQGEAGNVAHVGVSCYSSKDLYNWKNRGIALVVSTDPASDITKGCIIERPKVIYNAKTKKFVMWFHHELKGRGYSASRSGVAVADKPEGPYTFLRSFRPNAGIWPVNVTEAQKAALKDVDKLRGKTFDGGPNPETPKHPILARDYAGGQMARDMNLFIDDDGKAYHIYSSEENSTLHISLLSDDYQSCAGKYVRLFEHRWHEAPAVFKHKGRYWMITSGCTGWSPNAARSAVADSIWGPWKELGNPCIGVNPHNKLGPELTFGGQSTCVLPVKGKPGAFIAMFDIWVPKDAISGRYVWLPVVFENDRFTVTWKDEWKMSVFGNF